MTNGQATSSTHRNGGNSSNNGSIKFSEVYEPFPKVALALILTAVRILRTFCHLKLTQYILDRVLH
jgi:hypothetical protein